MTSVIAGEQGAAHFTFQDAQPLGHEVVEAIGNDLITAEAAQENAKRHLRSLRAAATALNHSDSPNDVANRESINDRFYDDNIGSRRDVPDFARTRRIIGWLSRAPYAELQQFCEWNAERAKLLQRTVDQDTPTIQAQVRARLEILEREVGLPKPALRAFDKALKEKPQLHTMDSFAAGGMHADAYFVHSGDGKIVLSNLYTLRDEFYDLSPEMIDAAFHEYMHASGYLSGAGLLHRRFLEELIVSHSTVVGAAGGAAPNIFDPIERPKGALSPGPYRAERRFFSIIEQYGPSTIQLDDMIAGLYNFGHKGIARKHFLQKTDRNLKAVVAGYRGTGLHGLCEDYEKAFHTADYPAFMKKLVTNAENFTAKKRRKQTVEYVVDSGIAASR
jgi:hypothetical protein